MFYILLIVLVSIRGGDFAPLLLQQQQLQNSPLKYFYPGFQQPLFQRPASYQDLGASYPYQAVFRQNLPSTMPEDNILLKQGLPGTVVGAIPFLPIHINLPDILAAIIKGLQSVLGPNLPLIGQPTIISQTPMATPFMGEAVDSAALVVNQKTGNMQAMPFPIIILIPQNFQSGVSIGNDHTDAKI